MYQHVGIRILLLQFENLHHGELFVNVASTVPKHHFASGDGVDVVAQVPVRAEDNLFVLREAFYNLLGVGGCHHHIGHGLDGCRGIDIRDDRVVGMFLHELGEVIGRTTVGQRTSGIEVGHQHFLVGAKHLGSLAHKMNATHHNDIGIRLGSPLCQSQAVAHKVGYILYFATLVVVSEDNGILFLAQLVNLRFQIEGLAHRLGDVPSFQPFFLIHYIYIFSSSFKKEIYTDDNCLLIVLVKKERISCQRSYLSKSFCYQQMINSLIC